MKTTQESHRFHCSVRCAHAVAEIARGHAIAAGANGADAFHVAYRAELAVCQALSDHWLEARWSGVLQAGLLPPQGADQGEEGSRFLEVYRRRLSLKHRGPHVTPKQKDMLANIHAGADPNLMFQLAKVGGPAEDRRCATTMNSLYKRGLLQIAKAGGLEISAKGTAAAVSIAKRATKAQS